MEKMTKILSIMIVILITMTGFSSVKAQFLYRNVTGSHLFVGPLPNNHTLSGPNPVVFIGPNFGIEYNCNNAGGLDLFIPFWSNYGYNQNVINLGSSGNVGIGTTAANNTYKLSVLGQIWTNQSVYIYHLTGRLKGTSGTWKNNVPIM